MITVWVHDAIIGSTMSVQDILTASVDVLELGTQLFDIKISELFFFWGGKEQGIWGSQVPIPEGRRMKMTMMIRTRTCGGEAFFSPSHQWGKPKRFEVPTTCQATNLGTCAATSSVTAGEAKDRIVNSCWMGWGECSLEFVDSLHSCFGDVQKIGFSLKDIVKHHWGSVQKVRSLGQRILDWSPWRNDCSTSYVNLSQCIPGISMQLKWFKGAL